MLLFDTHCHLAEEPLWSDLAGVLERSSGAGVGLLMVPAFDRASWPRVVGLTGRDGVMCALGLHPWAAMEGLDRAELHDLLVRHSCRAIGEIGLDYAVELPGRDVQARILESQLELACEMDLPVILHCRKAFDDLLTIVKSFAPGLEGLLHAFSRSPGTAEPFLEAGFHLAFGGAATRPDARRARAAVASAPEDRILLETDAPSIGMEGIPAGEVEPCHLPAVAAAVASIRGMTVERVAEVTTANAMRLFRA